MPEVEQGAESCLGELMLAMKYEDMKDPAKRLSSDLILPLCHADRKVGWLAGGPTHRLYLGLRAGAGRRRGRSLGGSSSSPLRKDSGESSRYLQRQGWLIGPSTRPEVVTYLASIMQYTCLQYRCCVQAGRSV